MKKRNTTPVSDRVKAMLAQPRGVPQARKIARQTTGYANGGKVQKAFLGKFLEKLGLRDASKLKQVSSTRQDPLDATGQSYTRMRPEPTPEQTVDIFQQKFAKRHQQKGGVMEKRKTYKEALKLKDKDRLTKRDIERAEELTKKFGGPQGTIKTSYEDIKALHEKLKKETPRGKGKEKGKEHRKKLLDLMRKATGYAQGFVTGKKKGGVILPKKRPKDKKLVEPFSDPVTKPIHKVLKHLKETIYEGKHYDFRHLRDPKIEAERGKSRAGKKKGGKVDKKGLANGGTVTRPND